MRSYRSLFTVIAAAVSLPIVLAAESWGATLEVAPGQSIQAAIAAAGDGDVIQLAEGLYVEDIDFSGKAITVAGVGPETVIMGSGARSVVIFRNGEPPEAVLDSVTITGGRSPTGGGIHINRASPSILRTVITQNMARDQGSGVYIRESTPLLANNLIIYNSTSLGDPHSVEIVDAAPVIVNNTIARGDSNGVIVRGASAAQIVNNIIAYNGSITNDFRRGRGICDFSGGLARIHYNLFARNRVGALLTGGTDYRRITAAEAAIGPPRLAGNINGPVGFAGRTGRDPMRTSVFAFRFAGEETGVPARDAGDPKPVYNDTDGSRNDIGFSGGPLAADWTR